MNYLTLQKYQGFKGIGKDSLSFTPLTKKAVAKDMPNRLRNAMKN